MRRTISWASSYVRVERIVSSDRVLGDLRDTVSIFENDRVRVWQVRLAPGEEGDVHRHELDHLLVQVAGDRIAVVPEPRLRRALSGLPRS